MEAITHAITWGKTNWQSIVVGLCAIDQLLGVIAPLTPWTFDDRLSRIVTNLLKRLVTKK